MTHCSSFITALPASTAELLKWQGHLEQRQRNEFEVLVDQRCARQFRSCGNPGVTQRQPVQSLHPSSLPKQRCGDVSSSQALHSRLRSACRSTSRFAVPPPRPEPQNAATGSRRTGDHADTLRPDYPFQAVGRREIEHSTNLCRHNRLAFGGDGVFKMWAPCGS